MTNKARAFSTPAYSLQYAAGAAANRARLSFNHSRTLARVARTLADARCVGRRFVAGVLRLIRFLHGVLRQKSSKQVRAHPSSPQQQADRTSSRAVKLTVRRETGYTAGKRK
jgi:hypothetical protein